MRGDKSTSIRVKKFLDSKEQEIGTVLINAFPVRLLSDSHLESSGLAESLGKVLHLAVEGVFEVGYSKLEAASWLRGARVEFSKWISSEAKKMV